MSLVPVAAQSLPLCPNTMSLNMHPAHRAGNLHGDRLYNMAAALRGEDDEYTDPAVGAVLDNLYPDDTMRLFAVEVAPTYMTPHATVSAWYFQCPTCGLILPAQPHYITP